MTKRRSRTLSLHSFLILAAHGCAALFVGIFLANPAFSLTATFDDLGLSAVAPGSFLDPPTSGGSFTSGGISFLNDGSFSGFSASTTMDSTTPGFGNQYSNITGRHALSQACRHPRLLQGEKLIRGRPVNALAHVGLVIQIL